tara:strand:- start:361 stop:867 length:507 start_codon:yes stop_codon:yes gene_type:complete
MLRIAITGPESSGKTTLCSLLSQHYNVSYIPEFARAYLEKTQGKYKQLDLDNIAQGQLKSLFSFEDKIVICDTDFSVLEIWSKYKYNNVSEIIRELVNKELFDLHILCTPDIPWEEDKLRENPHSRAHLFELYQSSLSRNNKSFIVVSGTQQNRIEKSLKAIEELINL